MTSWKIIDWTMEEAKRQGLTIATLSERAGVSTSSLKYAKQHKGMFRLDSLIMILNALGYDLQIHKKGE